MYEDVKRMIECGEYTLVEAKDACNNFLLHKQITAQEYDELMKMIENLEVNDDEDWEDIKYTNILKRVE